MSGNGCITVLCLGALLAILVTSQACPDEPFEMQMDQIALKTTPENLHIKPDARDEWGNETSRLVRDPEVIVEEEALYTTDVTLDTNRRMSNISSSLQGYRTSEDNVVVNVKKREPWYVPMLTWRWALITLYTAFACCRQNLYITANADLLNLIGDQDGSMGKYYELILPFCFVSGLIMGGIMEVTGVLMGMIILNLCGTLTSYLSVVPNLRIQWLTFLLSVINRASTFGAMLTYMTELTNVHNFPIVSGMTLVVAGVSLIVVNGSIQTLVLNNGPETWKLVQHWFGHLGIATFIIIYALHKLSPTEKPIDP